MREPPAIGVFDSGVGGLTVLAALMRHLPAEPLVYLGDTARVPYGTRSAEVVVRYALNNARTLAERVPLQMLVVACNTATAVALPALRERLSIPVIGVIEPGARAALEHHRGGSIAVLSTQGTARSGAYPAALAQLGFAGTVLSRACPLLVPLVEEGWLSGEVPERVVDHYLEGLPADVDTAVLGCTHYPLLHEVIAAAFARRVGPPVHIVDGAEATARAVCAQLAARSDDADAFLARQQRARAGADAPRAPRFWVTDAPEQLARLAPRFLGAPVDPASVELIDVVLAPERG